MGATCSATEKEIAVMKEIEVIETGQSEIVTEIERGTAKGIGNEIVSETVNVTDTTGIETGTVRGKENETGTGIEIESEDLVEIVSETEIATNEAAVEDIVLAAGALAAHNQKSANQTGEAKIHPLYRRVVHPATPDQQRVVEAACQQLHVARQSERTVAVFASTHHQETTKSLS